MKIAHIICTFPPYKSGMGNVAYHQAKELARAGHEVVIFTSDYCYQPSECQSVRVSEYDVKRLKPFFKFGNAAFLPQLLFRLRSFDIVELHYPFFGSQEIVWLAKKLGLIKGKLVIFYHMEFLTQKHKNTETQKTLKYYLSLIFFTIASLPSKIIYNSLLKMSDKILVSSFDYAQEMKVGEYFSQHKEKFDELPLGVDLERIKNYELRIKNKEDKIILFVGALDKAHYFKGIDVLLNAYKKIIYSLHITRPTCFARQQRFAQQCGLATRSGRAHYTLLIIGDGDLRSEYKKQARELGLQNKVKFLGQVSDEESQKYYASCNVLVLPSITSGEAFGLVLVEAMAHSKPVIASDLPGVRTVCQDNFNGFLVKPGDSDDLAEKIKIVLENEELAHKMGERGRKLVEKKYNWQMHGEELNEIFVKLKNPH